MLIDLHVHIKRTSGCAKAPAENIGKAAAKAGLRGIAILDHNYHATEEDCQIIVERSGGSVVPYRGCEISIREGRHHIVCITTAKIDIRLPCSWQTYVDWYRSNEAVTILAHPFKNTPTILLNIDIGGIDAIEYTSPKAPLDNRQRVYDVAIPRFWKMVANSDAHRMKDLGSFANQCNLLPANTEAFVRQFKSMMFVPCERVLTPIALSDHWETTND